MLKSASIEKHACKLCNYITKDKSNLNRHIKSIKHLQKVSNENKCKNALSDNKTPPPIQLPYTSHTTCDTEQTNLLQCVYCRRIFTRYDNLGRHLKFCSNKHKQEKERVLEDQIKTLNAKLHQYEKDAKYHVKETDHYKEEVDHYKEETNYYKQILKEAGGLVKKSVGSLTYIVDNYGNAPALQTITMSDIKTLETNEKKIVEDILSAYKHKTLGKYLGNFIIKLYKKDDPKSQSIWNTDDSRLTYLIKELLNNKSSNWVIDKKGIKTTKYLIDPLLLHIRKLLISYQKNLVIPDLRQNCTEIEFILENNKKSLELMDDIDDGVISKDILKWISSHLRFDGKLIKKAIK